MAKSLMNISQFVPHVFNIFVFVFCFFFLLFSYLNNTAADISWMMDPNVYASQLSSFVLPHESAGFFLPISSHTHTHSRNWASLQQCQKFSGFLEVPRHITPANNGYSIEFPFFFVKEAVRLNYSVFVYHVPVLSHFPVLLFIFYLLSIRGGYRLTMWLIKICLSIRF